VFVTTGLEAWAGAVRSNLTKSAGRRFAAFSVRLLLLDKVLGSQGSEPGAPGIEAPWSSGRGVDRHEVG